MEEELAIFFIFGGGATFLLGDVTDWTRHRGPDSWQGSGRGGGTGSMRHEIGDLQERVDFTERLIAQKRDQDQLRGRSGVQD